MKALETENIKESVHAVGKSENGKKQGVTRQRMKKTNTPMNDTLMCKSCGCGHGVKQECPAKSNVCFKCNKPSGVARGVLGDLPPPPPPQLHICRPANLRE